MAMKLSASQAAKEVGKSVPTITRAIKAGKLSATPLEGGGYEIDPAELFRVWKPKKAEEQGNTQPPVTGDMLGDATPKNADVTGMLEAEIRNLREMLALKDEMIDDLKDQRDKWQSQADRLLLEGPEKPRKGLLGMFGK